VSLDRLPWVASLRAFDTERQGRCQRYRVAFQPDPQHFGHAPRLGHAATGREGRLPVEDLADRTDPGLAEVCREAFEPAMGTPVARVHAQPGVDERTDQPGP